MCVSFFVTCRDVNLYAQKKSAPYPTNYSRFSNAVSNCLTVKLFYIHTPRFHFGHMNAFPILNFIHDEEKFFAYHFRILNFGLLFEFHFYFIMLLVQKCINVYVRKLTPRQVMIPWAMG